MAVAQQFDGADDADGAGSNDDDVPAGWLVHAEVSRFGTKSSGRDQARGSVVNP
jgi:hypothetical protein